MNNVKISLPNKLFGREVGVWMVWLIPGSVILILIIAFGWVIMPRIESVNNNFAKIETLATETKALNDKRIYLLSLDQTELRAKSLLMENGVLSEKNSYLLVKIVSKVVADHGFSIDDFSVSLGDVKQVDKKTSSFDYQKVPVEVIITGPKNNFLEMIKGIENSLPVLSIDNFNMTTADEVSTIKMNVSTYYLPDWNQTKLESLSVTDLTPSKDEAAVLSQIGEYKYYGATEAELKGNGGSFVPNNRIDPFY